MAPRTGGTLPSPGDSVTDDAGSIEYHVTPTAIATAMASHLLMPADETDRRWCASAVPARGCRSALSTGRRVPTSSESPASRHHAPAGVSQRGGEDWHA